MPSRVSISRRGGSCGVKLASGSTVGTAPAGAGEHVTLAAVAAVTGRAGEPNETIEVSSRVPATIQR
jgi:hypothetical protein